MHVLKTEDQEEYMYREVMLTQVVNLSLILLKYSSEHSLIYDLFRDFLGKAGSHYSIAESFTTMEGIQTLLQE